MMTTATIGTAAAAANSFLSNPILLADSYKLTHNRQYPKGTEYVYSYVEARGSQIDGVQDTVFFGLQGFIKSFLSVPITQANVDQAAAFAAAHGVTFNKEGFEYIVETYNGFWPVEISAVPEGSPIALRNPVLTIVNTDPKAYWVTSFLETALLRACWYGTTVATVSRTCKQLLAAAMEISCDDPTVKLPFMLHDFGARGVSSFESAAIGGAAHIVNFSGTDTMSGLAYAMDFYGADVCAFSVPASEHSTMTSWGRAFEEEAYANMLKEFGKPGALFSVVSDSYDLDAALRKLWGGVLKGKVIASGATLVVRPDSGKPSEVVCETIETLMECYGETVNSKGYRLLPDCVRVIQGDGISIDSLPEILEAMLERKLSLDNIVFGMGGGLLQQVNRDTFKFAMKCSAAKVNGYWRDVYKDPAGDQTKRSKAGRVTTVMTADGEQATRLVGQFNEGDVSMLRPVWCNGSMLVDDNFADIRARAALPLEQAA